MAAIQKKVAPCICTGACTGYGTHSNCPPLIVLAVAAAQTRIGGQTKGNSSQRPGGL